MSKLSPLAPLSTIHSVPLHKGDFDFEIQDESNSFLSDEFVSSFDLAWTALIQERGSFVGTHESKISELQNTAIKLKQSKDGIKSDLKKQALYVRNSRAEMELSLRPKIEKVSVEHAVLTKKFQIDKNTIDTMKRDLYMSLYWQQFEREIDRLMTMSSFTANRQLELSANKSVLFKERALFLANRYRSSVRLENATKFFQRSRKVENLLLRNHIDKLILDIKSHQDRSTLHHEFRSVVNELHK